MTLPLTERLKRSNTKAQIAKSNYLAQVYRQRSKILKAGYDAVKTHPQRRAIVTENRKTEDDQLGAIDRLKAIALARNLIRNHPLIEGMVNRVIDSVVGAGCRLQLKTKDTEKDKVVEGWYNDEWAQREVCDGRSRMDLWSYQRATFDQWYTDGENLVWFDDSEKGGPQMFGFEADQFCNPTDWKLPKGHTITDGIVTDRFGKPLKYVIHPTGKRTAPKKECMIYNASRVFHVATFRRFRQTHGISRIINSGGMSTDLLDYIKSDLLSSKAAAKFAMWVKRQNAMEFEGVRTGNDIDVEGTGDDAPEGGTSEALSEAPTYNRLEEYTGGVFEYLNPGEDIGVIKPERPNNAFGDYVRSVIRIIGAGNSLPLEMVLLDFSQTNYSSARAALLLAWITIKAMASWFDGVFNRPVAIKALEWGEKHEGLVLPDGWQTSMKFTHPKLPEIDRLKTEAARTMALANNTTTLRDEVEDWEEIIEQRKLEIEKLKEAGLSEPQTEEQMNLLNQIIKDANKGDEQE